MAVRLRIRDVKPGMKLRCIWYPSFTEACGKLYGIVPNHPRRGEVVTVDKVLPAVISVFNVRQRISLREYHSSEGFSLSSFELTGE